ncbi:hypothetical protein Cni_G01164 [Canna indica]|uniref:Uncharacterized protein n=1 Tax=Canna indica TaxID=4628 RepID=A0AAQ3JNQ5_9LILI|nr:hypothetical protein Cni_G01164 [Canna indica]
MQRPDLVGIHKIQKKNEETFNLTDSQEAYSNVEIREYNSTRSKSSCNESHRCAKRKRKTEIGDISRKAEVSSVPFQNVIIDDSDEDVNSKEEEAVRMYPQFFELIPQKPHYRGLLDDAVSEEVRQDV